MKATIWHNPKCGTSRKTLAILEETPGVEVTVVEYLKNPPSRGEIRHVLELLDIPAHDLLRHGESAYRELELSKKTDEAALVEAMIHHPILIERPVVITDEAAVIARPPEAVLSVI